MIGVKYRTENAGLWISLNGLSLFLKRIQSRCEEFVKLAITKFGTDTPGTAGCVGTKPEGCWPPNPSALHTPILS